GNGDGKVENNGADEEADTDVEINEVVKVEFDSGEGKQKKRSAGVKIDRSRFTNEVKVQFPEVGDDSAGLGVIEKWYKAKGDIIKRDEVICDIRTNLFTFGMLTDDDYDSIMEEILVPEESEPINPLTIICTTFNEGGVSTED
ncbi:hypothetical protein ACHAWF_000810, partial [Thalassiosira exigua]